ncbi:Regulator of chromosome condensation (RCC1) repeat [Carpediemonas membranifera]|uniref:Regulator of chromosome condensation (RCC1) repeat n=1 Tax=Carpediemonas membranifera TaxID=201153 RepID=A0A8J6B106_9EUKA|nr:Regulator of chromosome condensation (RCC1) repeat [Carpediemonas membranifera]|eukprot:KAG9396120.1 Regulator of chromosome condensation (RCC1) repeat [Carpediemonas membranifera]
MAVSFKDAKASLNAAKAALERFVGEFDDEGLRSLTSIISQLTEAASDLDGIKDASDQLKSKIMQPVLHEIIPHLGNVRAFLRAHETEILARRSVMVTDGNDLKHVKSFISKLDNTLRAGLASLSLAIPPFTADPDYIPVAEFSGIVEFQSILDKFIAVQESGGDKIDPAFSNSLSFCIRLLKQVLFIHDFDPSRIDKLKSEQYLLDDVVATVKTSTFPILFVHAGLDPTYLIQNRSMYGIYKLLYSSFKPITYDHTQFFITAHRLITRGNNLMGQSGAVTHAWAVKYKWIRLPGRVCRVISDFGSTFVVTDRGLFAFGNNNGGKLGLGLPDRIVHAPHRVPLPQHVRVVDVCVSHMAVFVKTDAGWFSCGTNYSGQLGLGHVAIVHTPQPVPGSGRISRVHSDYMSTFAWTDDGELLACGSNDVGQLGIGSFDQTTSFTPVIVPAPDTVCSVVGGPWSASFLTTDGKCYGCGMSRGQLGLPLEEETGIAEPTLVTKIEGEISGCISDGDSTIFLCGRRIFVCGQNFDRQFPVDRDEILDPVEVTFPFPLRRIALGGRGLFVQREDTGQWLARGDNQLGQLGVGGRSNVVAETTPVRLDDPGSICTIYSAGDATAFIGDEGCFVAGSNEQGMLGIDEEGVCTPVPVQRTPDAGFFKLPMFEFV